MLVQVNLAQLQVDEFAHAQSAAVEHLHHRAVAVAFVGREVDSRHHPVDLVESEYRRQVFGFTRSFEQFRRVLVDVVFVKQKAEPRVYARQYSCLRGFGRDGFELVEDEGLELLKIHVHIVYRVLLRIGTQFVQVHLVGLHRVGRESLFQFQVLVVSAHNTLGVFGAES